VGKDTIKDSQLFMIIILQICRYIVNLIESLPYLLSRADVGDCGDCGSKRCKGALCLFRRTVSGSMYLGYWSKSASGLCSTYKNQCVTCGL